MKVAYIQCVGGVSGDMLLGALVAAGVAPDLLRDRLAALHLEGFELDFQAVSRRGIAATHALVQVTDHATERHLPQILAIIEASDLPARLIERARSVFRRLGEKEAAIHGSSLEQVHLHELGGIDTIVDVVGVLAGFDALEADRVVCSPVPVGSGFVRAAHGRLPLPAPATLALLEGVPIYGSGSEGEMVTPTGAALITELADEFGPVPPLVVQSIGYGAGTRDGEIPNVLRLLVGEAPAANRRTVEQLVLIETNIDDMSPEIYEHVAERLFQAGALDVFAQAVQMKKNRPGTLLSVLGRHQQRTALTDVLLRETTTLGVREQLVGRISLPRETRNVHTEFGDVRVKVAFVDAETVKMAPEYDDCRARATATGAALAQVYRAALRAAEDAHVTGPPASHAGDAGDAGDTGDAR